MKIQKKYILSSLAILITLMFLGGFVAANQINYVKQKELEYTLIKHPDHLPNAQTSEFASF